MYMQIEQRAWTKDTGWKIQKSMDNELVPQLILVFGSRKEIEAKKTFEELSEFYPKGDIIMASTAGEILGTHVTDDSLSVTAVHFEKTKIKTGSASINNSSQSHTRGEELAASIPHKDLAHVMVFSEGLKVNGTALVEGLINKLPKDVAITGGLVGDAADFKKTVVGLNKQPKSGEIVIVGFYGKSIQVGYGSLGGWDPFGPERIVTKSKDNVLLELDDKPALDLYKKYLGDKAEGLPGTGLLFPLKLTLPKGAGSEDVVRTLLAVNEKKHSMTFAGDIPEGVKAQLMKANFERLIDGAEGAATMSASGSNMKQAELALLISCVGRKLVLKDKVEEEVEAVQSELGKDVTLAGFYSYGEISPVAPTEKQCRLHNQTMTITTFREM